MEVLAGLFHYATDTAKCVCYETATTEVSAYINFAESEVEKPADEWDALPLDEKSTWIPDEDTVKFVADRDDWKSVVLWSGWPVLCAGVLDVPVYQPTWKPLKPKGFKITKSKLDKLAKLILDKRFTFVDDVGLQSDLTQHVLDIHQFATRSSNASEMVIPSSESMNPGGFMEPNWLCLGHRAGMAALSKPKWRKWRNHVVG